jgi:diketogulonate reductase-like aldo/keto reductase
MRSLQSSPLNKNSHAAAARSGMDANLQELGLDYVDLTLMHFPVGTVGNKSVYDYVEVCERENLFLLTANY